MCLGLPVHTCAARSDGRGEFRLPANRRTHRADRLAKLGRTGPARLGGVSNFCRFVYFFKDEKAARKWAATRAGTQVITIDQGMELARMKNNWQFGPLP